MKRTTHLILIFILHTILACNINFENIFTDETFQDTIKQNIGGELIRIVHHYDDFHSFDYDIKYYYKDKFDSICYIGFGRYHGQKLPKDEQLRQLGNLTVFKTSGDREKDMLFINDNNSKIWTEYEISPKSIEQTDMWKKQNINSQIGNWDTVSKIENIDENGKITVRYIYAKKNRIFSFITGKRLITYKIDLQTGELEMIEVSKINMGNRN